MEIKTYVLNPSYNIFYDGVRYFIAESDIRSLAKNQIVSSEFFGFIHQIHAFCFSIFDGKNTYDECISLIAERLNIPITNAQIWLNKFIENINEINIESDGNIYMFPKKLLIENHQGITRDFSKIPIIDFSENIQVSSQINRLNIPLDIMFIVNTNCYTDCIYCYADKKTHYNSIPFSKIKETIIEAKKLGVRSFDLNGGEVLMYKYWKELIKFLIDNDFNPYISTKIPLDSSAIKELKKTGLKRIQISLDSIIDNELQEILKVNRDYRDNILETIKQLDNEGFEIRINTIVTSHSNKDSIISLINHLLTINNITSINIQAAGYSIYKGVNNYNNYKPQVDTINSIREYVYELKKRDLKKILEVNDFELKDEYENIEKRSKRFTDRGMCSGNVRCMVILPDGKVTICEELYWHPQFIIGDLNNNSIKEIWNSKKALELYNISKSDISDESNCKNCTSFETCRYDLGVCWKMVFYAYNTDKWDWPDPRCPLAPEAKNTFYMP